MAISKRPSLLIIFLASMLIFSLGSCWYYVTVTRLEHRVNLNSENVLSQFQSEIEHLARLIEPMNSSSANLARLMSSTLGAIDDDISFSHFETKVAPLLFQAFETVPYLAQISYIGIEGLFFSFYSSDDQVMAMYSNSTSSNWDASDVIHKYFIQHVNRDNGKLYGDATICNELSINASWVREAFDSSSGYASLGTKWNNGHDLIFISSARITTRRVISMGFDAKPITDFFTHIGQHGARLYLASKDGNVFLDGFQHTLMEISNDMISFQSMNSANGDQTVYEGAVSCKDGAVASNLNIQGIEYLMHCSFVNIMGVESVYVLAAPHKGGVSFIIKCNKKNGLVLLILMVIMVFIAIASFLFSNADSARAVRREKEATKVAEQKSINKSLALHNASHDIRNLLTGLSGLIEMSYHLVVPGSELDTNLKQIDSGTKDLLEILDSILDMGKIEAGKMELEEEEFNVFQLLQEVADWYRPQALKKGVDIELDPCIGSELRYSRAKGDRVKLKRVLCNLLNNAVKFTDEGRIVIRAWAQKATLHKSVVAANRSGNIKRRWWLRLFSMNNEALGDVEAMNSTQQDPGGMSFTFEVDDTGKGIPKDKHKSVFENYVQVKENALAHGGTGLGLGIVQSFVRLMHGTIGIVDKDTGEKGTCFRFNVLLTACETKEDDTAAEGESRSGDRNKSEGLTIRTTGSGSSLLPEYGGCSSSREQRESGPRVSPRISSVAEGEKKLESGKPSNDEKPLRGKKILLVEDNNVLRMINGITLERLGASIEKCENGEQAVQLVEKGLTGDCPNLPYDCILMDCQMPVMNGFEATRRIREIEKPFDVHIPVIALTANSGDETKKTIEAGMDDCIVKPTNMQCLLEAIRNIHNSQ